MWVTWHNLTVFRLSNASIICSFLFLSSIPWYKFIIFCLTIHLLKGIWVVSCFRQLLISSVQSLSHFWLFATPWIAARQATLSITNSWNLFKLMSIELVMPSNHLILCHPLFLPPSTFPSIRVFSNESVLPIRWPKYWSFSFRISPSNEYSGLISFMMAWLDVSILLANI